MIEKNRNIPSTVANINPMKPILMPLISGMIVFDIMMRAAIISEDPINSAAAIMDMTILLLVLSNLLIAESSPL